MPARANDPEEKARKLQRSLWVSAKQSRTRRFHALYDHIHGSDVLWEAWRRVRKNRGAAGVDGETLAAIEARGVEAFLGNIQEKLKAGKYRPSVVRRRYIPKADGKQRPLGIPTVRDRVVQMAAKIVVEPIFEADFLPYSYGFRPKRSATQALEAVREAGNRGHNFVVDADIKAYFDSIDQNKLMEMVGERITDRRVLKLMRQWLRAGVLEDGAVRQTLAGTPQGGVISPLLANIYLHHFDRAWDECKQLGVLVRYADDFVIMCKTQSQANAALRRVTKMMTGLGLMLHSEKTRLVDLRRGREGFTFLGCVVRKRRSLQRNPLKHFMQRWPSPRAQKAVRCRVHELTSVRGNRAKNLDEVIERLNPVLRGWGNYFRTGNADREFNHLDGYVYERLTHWIRRRGGQRTRFRFDQWPQKQMYELGLHRLQGTVKYPVHAASVRPSVSCVRGAAYNGVVHAGESPVAAIARFGCAAMPDVDGGRPSLAQAQAKALGAEKSDPSGGRAKLGAAAESEHCSVDMAPTRSGLWGNEQPSPIPAWAKANGYRRRQRANAVGVCSGTWMVAPREWTASQSREGLDAKGSVGSETGGSGRSSYDVEGQHNPDGAKDLWDSGVLGQARIVPKCLRANGSNRSCSGPSTNDTTNPMRYRAGKVVSNAKRTRCLEAVLGKTRRTEFQRGP
ncbi:MAG: group II intron reverse transcriptase/maturase [Elusimicrobiota bacterium]